jgi:PAS domain S-box-containing protein
VIAKRSSSIKHRHGKAQAVEHDMTSAREVRPKQLKAPGAQSAFQARIEELERTLEGYREQVQTLSATVEELRKERPTVRDCFENAPAAYIVHDSGGEIVELSRAAEALLELKPRRGIKLSMIRFLEQGKIVLWMEHVRRSASKLQPVLSEMRLRVNEHRSKEVILLTCRSPGEDPGLFNTLILETRQLRNAEIASAEAQQDYRRLMDRIEGIVWEAEAQDLTVTFVNGYAQRLLGFTLEDWRQPGFWPNRIFVQDRERVLLALSRALLDRKELRIDYRVVASDRRLVWLHDSITVFQREGREMLQGVAIDVTEQRDAEERLHQAHDSLEQHVLDRTRELRQTVSELEAFSYSLSHDMRAPIRAMQGYAVLLKNLLGEQLGPKPAEFLQRITQGAERLDLLVQDVLKYSRLARAPLQLKPVPLEPLLENILHDYPVLAPPQAQVEIQSPLPSVCGHEAFVGQALSNLLTNAVKFVPNGQTPHVRIWAGPARSDPNPDEAWVRIWIEDNGLGIAPEDQKRIFRIFERVYPKEQYEGTGIGLAIVQRAVERLGGRLGVESAPGQGSKFWIELRRA